MLPAIEPVESLSVCQNGDMEARINVCGKEGRARIG